MLLVLISLVSGRHGLPGWRRKKREAAESIPFPSFASLFGLQRFLALPPGSIWPEMAVYLLKASVSYPGMEAAQYGLDAVFSKFSTLLLPRLYAFLAARSLENICSAPRQPSVLTPSSSPTFHF